MMESPVDKAAITNFCGYCGCYIRYLVRLEFDYHLHVCERECIQKYLQKYVKVFKKFDKNYKGGY